MSTLAPPPVRPASLRSSAGLVPASTLRLEPSPPPVPNPLTPIPVVGPIPQAGSPLAARLRHDLLASVWDAGAYSAMVGLGENYFGAYVLALGLGPGAAGLMVTLPVLLGATLQLATPWGVRKLGSHKHWVVAGIATQVLCLLMLPLAALFISTTAAVISFSAVAFYWAAGLAGNPPWNTWMEDVVPLQIRTRFFACRQRTSQICLLAGFVVGGLALQYGQFAGRELMVFAAIFLTAAGARFLSGCFVATQSEPSRGKVIEERVSLRDLFSTGGRISGGSLVVYLLAMQVAVQISGPYFTPFMLKQEKWSYLTYMLLLGFGFLGKVIALPLWGRLGQRVGAARLMWVGGLAIVPISSLWLISDLFRGMEWQVGGVTLSAQFAWIAAVQLLSGITWAAYELAMALLFLHGIPREQRTSLLTLYNFGNSAAMVVGALIGWSLFRILGEHHSTYMTLFVLSSAMRLMMVPLLVRVRG